MEATEVIVETESVDNSLSACSCERIVPCDTSITQPILMAIPEFWRTVTIANFICYLSPSERSELLMDIQNSENWVFGRTQADFDAQMAILDAAVIEIMAANEVEGSAHYTFYMNNLLYGLWGMHGPDLIREVPEPVPAPPEAQ
ncbi:MAG: hypothetical protein HRU71_12105 [Planctomycetia bacterium]|nr:MAG: hypothetical protein HRU71_12105 [Planctomycetia bacterium]